MGAELDGIPLDALIPPEYQTAGQQVQTASVSDHRIEAQEYDVIRLMLNYGLLVVKTEHLEIDEDNKEHIKQVEVAVNELIVHELEKDEIEFHNPVYQKIFDEVANGLKNNELLGENYFLRHEDQEISSKAVDIVSNRYEISPNWTAKKVYTTLESEKLELAIKQAIYSFKSAKLRHEKEIIQAKIAQLDASDEDQFVEIVGLMKEQRKLDTVIGALSNNDTLGRVIH
jgi:DNA primase